MAKIDLNWIIQQLLDKKTRKKALEALKSFQFDSLEHCKPFKVVDSFGNNKFQLGFPLAKNVQAKAHRIDSNTKETISIATNVKQIACSGQLSVILSEDGKVVQFGSLLREVRQHLHIVPGLISITQVAVGHDHILAINDRGQIFAWGSNQYGQLGQGNSDSHKPRRIESGGLRSRFVKNIAAGSYHSLALLDGGDVYSWGSNANGQLGLLRSASGNISDKEEIIKQSNTPKRAAVSVVCTSVSAAYDHSAVITETGSLKLWGTASFSPMNVFKTILKTKSATADSGDDGWLNVDSGTHVIKSVALGLHHGLALTTAHRLFSFAMPSMFQKMGSTGSGITVDPSKMFPKRSRKHSFNSMGTTAATSSFIPDKRVLGVADSIAKQLRPLQPVEVTLPGIGNKIAAGADHSICILSDGRMLTWGSNHAELLGRGLDSTEDLSIPTVIPELYPVLDVAASENHNLVVSGLNRPITSLSEESNKKKKKHGDDEDDSSDDEDENVIEELPLFDDIRIPIPSFELSSPSLQKEESSNPDRHIPSLEELCSKAIAGYTDDLNFPSVLCVALMVENYELMDFCDKFFQVNLPQVLTRASEHDLEMLLEMEVEVDVAEDKFKIPLPENPNRVIETKEDPSQTSVVDSAPIVATEQSSSDSIDLEKKQIQRNIQSSLTAAEKRKLKHSMIRLKAVRKTLRQIGELHERVMRGGLLNDAEFDKLDREMALAEELSELEITCIGLGGDLSETLDNSTSKSTNKSKKKNKKKQQQSQSEPPMMQEAKPEKILEEKSLAKEEISIEASLPQKPISVLAEMLSASSVSKTSSKPSIVPSPVLGTSSSRQKFKRGKKINLSLLNSPKPKLITKKGWGNTPTMKPSSSIIATTTKTSSISSTLSPAIHSNTSIQSSIKTASPFSLAQQSPSLSSSSSSIQGSSVSQSIPSSINISALPSRTISEFTKKQQKQQHQSQKPLSLQELMMIEEAERKEADRIRHEEQKKKPKEFTPFDAGWSVSQKQGTGLHQIHDSGSLDLRSMQMIQQHEKVGSVPTQSVKGWGAVPMWSTAAPGLSEIQEQEEIMETVRLIDERVAAAKGSKSSNSGELFWDPVRVDSSEDAPRKQQSHGTKVSIRDESSNKNKKRQQHKRERDQTRNQQQKEGEQKDTEKSKPKQRRNNRNRRNRSEKTVSSAGATSEEQPKQQQQRQRGESRRGRGRGRGRGRNRQTQQRQGKDDPKKPITSLNVSAASFVPSF